MAATIITSPGRREWVALFDDSILANSALDRYARRTHQIVMEGPSLRAPRPLRSPKAGRRPAEKADSGGYQRGLASSNTVLEAPRPD